MRGSDAGNDVLSVRQMMVLLTVALFAVATDLLPSVVARQMGRGGWLIGLGISPVLLLALWLGSRVFRRRSICEIAGKPARYIIIIMYLLWGLFVLAAVLRLSAARMEEIYGKVPSFWIAVLMLAVAVWVGMGKAAALARAAEIFFLALAATVAGVLLLGTFEVKWQNLYPVEWTQLPAGSFCSASILLNVAPLAVLGTRISPKKGSKRAVCGWAIAFCVGITWVLVVVLGSVGSGLSARLEIPYLIMVQGLGIKGAFQRTEALVAAVWLLSDLILCGALLRAGNDYITELKSEHWGRWGVPALAIAALAVGWLLFPADAVRAFCIRVLPVTGMIAGIILPIILQVIAYGRTRKGG